MEQITAALPNSLKMLGLGSEPMSPQQYEQAKADIYNASVGDLNEEDGYNCDLCKNKGHISKVLYNEQFGYYSEALTPCKCNRVRNAIRRLNRSGLKNVVKEYTFDKYEALDPWQKHIKETAQRFCTDQAHDWFFIGGQSGAGKTHICTAIAVACIKQGKDARYMLWLEEIKRIKALVTEQEQYSKILKELKETPVLYIDDLFKVGKGPDGQVAPPTKADIDVAFEILNHRYNNAGLITIISSERTLSELLDIDEAVAGRIAERSKAGGYCLNLKKDSSRNWRLRGMEEI